MQITVDGAEYHVKMPIGGLKRSFQVTDGKNAGRTLSGLMVRDIIGTYYNYEMQIQPDARYLSDYDSLYEVLSSPDADFHTVSVPYGQNILTFEAYVTSGQDALSRQAGNTNYWHGLSVQFIAKEPQKVRAGSESN